MELAGILDLPCMAEKGVMYAFIKCQREVPQDSSRSNSDVEKNWHTFLADDVANYPRNSRVNHYHRSDILRLS